MRTRGGAKRVVVVSLLAWAAAGAAVNLMVAAACALWSPAGSWGIKSRYGQPPRAIATMVLDLPSPAKGMRRHVSDAEAGGIGVRVASAAITDDDSRANVSLAGVFSLRSGWPFDVLCSNTSVPFTSISSPMAVQPWRNALEVPKWMRPVPVVVGTDAVVAFPSQLAVMPRPLPLHIEWSGAILGSLFWAAAIGLPLMFARYIRRYRRLIHAKCPACGYPLGATATCSECGERLAVRAVDVR